MKSNFGSQDDESLKFTKQFMKWNLHWRRDMALNLSFTKIETQFDKIVPKAGSYLSRIYPEPKSPHAHRADGAPRL